MKNSQFRYRINDDNLLMINDEVVEGMPSIDEHNRLIYWLNEPQVWQRRYRLPNKLIFTGVWQLDDNHDLGLEIEEAGGAKKVLAFKGEIICAESDKLVFEIAQGTVPASKIRLLKLSGTWGSDEVNRIFFSVSKKPQPDMLTFQSGWKLNKNQQIVYTYQKTNLKTKEKVLSELLFSGFWQITSENRLAYIISCSTNSKFDFRVQLETSNVYPKDGEIRYRIGIGARQVRPEKLNVISLYGTWKFSRKLGLAFDMEYAKEKIHSLNFGAEVNFNKNNEVIFVLKDEYGRPLGINVIFTRRFLKQSDAQLFLRLKHSREELGVDAGLRIPF